MNIQMHYKLPAVGQTFMLLDQKAVFIRVNQSLGAEAHGKSADAEYFYGVNLSDGDFILIPNHHALRVVFVKPRGGWAQFEPETELQEAWSRIQEFAQELNKKVDAKSGSTGSDKPIGGLHGDDWEE